MISSAWVIILDVVVLGVDVAAAQSIGATRGEHTDEPGASSGDVHGASSPSSSVNALRTRPGLIVKTETPYWPTYAASTTPNR